MILREQLIVWNLVNKGKNQTFILTFLFQQYLEVTNQVVVKAKFFIEELKLTNAEEMRELYN